MPRVCMNRSPLNSASNLDVGSLVQVKTHLSSQQVLELQK